MLTSEDIAKYDIHYIGKQKVDDIDCYQFTVKPKTMLKGERYFEGDIWVDDRDLQIVKTYGKGVGLLKKSEDNQFPRFETSREQIDGKSGSRPIRALTTPCISRIRRSAFAWW